MRRIYAIAAFLACSMGVNAQVEQNIKPSTLVDGSQYVLVNKAMNPTQYMSRTSWDGAMYFLGRDDSNYANHQLTAVKNEDDTWSFTIEGSLVYETGEYDETGKPITATYEGTLWMCVPAETDNVNIKSMSPVKWRVEESAKFPGFYQLTAGEGTGNQLCLGLKMHLNGGHQYVVISESSNSWYPDFAGGVVRDYDEETGEESITVNDSTSFNWGFVKLEDLPAYMGDLSASIAINDFHATYIASGDYSDYEDGFLTSYNAASAIYTGAEYNWEEDPATISEMLNAKVSLYNEIDQAELLDEPTDALSSAIATAKTSFKTATITSEISNAIETLKKAVAAFKEGTGDLTALGSNMSFEDLSAQGGATTSSLAPPPSGWNMYINGKQVTTVDEIRPFIANWCGVNADSNGEGKEGDMSFGIWTSGVPEFELSQTISGLENGTYIVSAGLMAGSNGSGSRLTTQRIFGNLNSAYYGEEGLYNEDELDKSEAYAFANNPEIQTDQELRNVSVRAYVYDGTLTFGVRTNGNIAATNRISSNPAGGDGWFKVDNFTIQKVGFDASDAAATANHYIDVLNAYLTEEVFEATLEEKIKEQMPESELTSETPVEEINNIITTLSPQIPIIEQSIAAYKKLNEALEKMYVDSEEYSYTPSFTSDILPAIENVEIAIDTRNVDAAGIDALIAAMEAALAKAQSEAVQVGEYTNVIKNASFEDLSAQGNQNSNGVVNPPAGWTLVFNGQECAASSDYASAGVNVGWCAINGGDGIDASDEGGNYWSTQYTDGDHLWGIWGQDMPEVELSQTFKGMPAGTYVLSCDMVVQWNWGGQCLTTQRIFANDYIQMFGAADTYAEHPNDTKDMTIAYGIDNKNPNTEVKHITFAGHYQSEQGGVTDCPRHLEMTFGLTEGSDLKIGFRTNNVDVVTGTPHPYDSAGWFKLDNFKLLYLSETVPAGADAKGTVEGDVDEDGLVNISDVVAVINHIAGIKSYPLADVDNDDSVNITDVVRIINIIASN